MDTTVHPTVDENARRRFEAAWRAGKPQSVEQFLPPPEQPHYLATLEELIHIDLEFAWKLAPCEGGNGAAGSKVRFSLIGESISCPANMSPISR